MYTSLLLAIQVLGASQNKLSVHWEELTAADFKDGIARAQGIELSQFLYERFQLRRVNDLSITQASAAIDGLRAAAGI